jgi:hypothetical protein
MSLARSWVEPRVKEVKRPLHHLDKWPWSRPHVNSNLIDPVGATDRKVSWSLQHMPLLEVSHISTFLSRAPNSCSECAHEAWMSNLVLTGRLGGQFPQVASIAPTRIASREGF